MITLDSITHALNVVTTSGTGQFILAALITVTMQPIKNFLKKEAIKQETKPKDWLVVFITAVFSFAPVAVAYLANAVTKNPNVLGQETTAIFAFTQAIYFFPGFGIKSLSALWNDAKNYRQAMVTPSATPAPAVDPSPAPVADVTEFAP